MKKDLPLHAHCSLTAPFVDPPGSSYNTKILRGKHGLKASRLQACICMYISMYYYKYRSLFSDHSAHGDPTIPTHHGCQPPCTEKGNREFLGPLGPERLGGDQSRQPMTQRLQTSPRQVKKHPPTVPPAGAWQLRVGNSLYRSVLSEKPMSGSPAPNFGRAYLEGQISLESVCTKPVRAK